MKKNTVTNTERTQGTNPKNWKVSTNADSQDIVIRDMDTNNIVATIEKDCFAKNPTEEIQKLAAIGHIIRQSAYWHDELVKQLSIMTSLCRIKYGNLDADVYAEIEKSETLIKNATK